MLKATFDDFLTKHPGNGMYKNDPVARKLFDVLNSEENIEAMIAACKKEMPALTLLVKTIRDTYASIDPALITDWEQKNDAGFSSNAVGVMAKVILEPFGWIPKRNRNGKAIDERLPVVAHLPVIAGTEWPQTGAIYERKPS
jgi:hypothetical protein